MKFPPAIDVLRPGQWIKNALVLAGFFFAVAVTPTGPVWPL